MVPGLSPLLLFTLRAPPPPGLILHACSKHSAAGVGQDGLFCHLHYVQG